MMFDFHARIEHLRQRLSAQNLEAFLINDSINLYYLTGLELSTGLLLITQKYAYLFVDGRYFEIASKKGLGFEVLALDKDALIKLLKRNELDAIHKIGIDEKYSYQFITKLQKQLLEVFGEKKIAIPCENLVENLRRIKDAKEIQAIREAAKLCCEGVDFICSELKEGITEKELADSLEIFWKKKGADGLAFEPIIAFGENGSMPHYRSGPAKLKKNQAVLIDIGVKLNKYCSDMTRIAFYGEPPKEIQAIASIVEEALISALKLCKPQVTVGELDKKARDIIGANGYRENFTHSLGHGLGLEVHEKPILRSSDPEGQFSLEEGMVITIEPGIYLSEIGGIRLEEMVLITKDGYELLTHRQLINAISM